MRKSILLLSLLVAGSISSFGQYAPQAGLPGSTAIPAGSNFIRAWGNSCTVSPGWQNINNQVLGRAGAGVAANACGPADGSIVSLGDSGIAVIHFPYPVADGAGYEFAVFENGFLNPADSTRAYLELAFVEVSSDGINYFRFPAQSAADTTVQIAGVGQYSDAAKYHNLAGKYRSMYGTPFDLADIPDHPLLNKRGITHLRVVDVIGNISEPGLRDASGRKINDPYPTPFTTGGFDLDAVAVLQPNNSQSVNAAVDKKRVSVFPNPAVDAIVISLLGENFSYELRSADGRQVMGGEAQETVKIAVRHLPKGLYYVQVKTATNELWREKIILQ